MSVLHYWLSINRSTCRRDMAPTTKWTSKADNGRTFRGKPCDTEENALRRQFKKPRRSGEEVRVDTGQVVIEVEKTEVQVDTAEVVIDVEETAEVVIEVAEDSVIEIAEDSDGSEDNIPFRLATNAWSVSTTLANRLLQRSSLRHCSQMSVGRTGSCRSILILGALPVPLNCG